MQLVQRLSSGAGVVVGIDPHPSRLPEPIFAQLSDPRRALSRWGVGVLEALVGLVCAVKPQVAFFEQFGAEGVAALQVVCAEARRLGIPVILDAKRGDIGSTATAYARACLHPDGPMAADAVTLSPYLGPESMAPFLDLLGEEKMVFVLVATSNPGAGLWQESIGAQVADWIAATNIELGRPAIGAVVGATVSGAMWRQRMPQAWFLAPGVGAQGAGLGDLAGHARRDGAGVLPVSARGVLFGKTAREGADWNERLRTRAEGFQRSFVREEA